MSRKSTGTVRILPNDAGEAAWHGKWAYADGTRSKWLPLPGKIALGDRKVHGGTEALHEAY